MFFRRAAVKQISFQDYLEKARAAGFTLEANGDRALVSRSGVAAEIAAGPNGAPYFTQRAGVLINGKIALLVDGGFQKFFQVTNGIRKPALAPELRALHVFQEDLREALGLVSLYNESLGTVSTQYIYDRVEDRDKHVPRKPWEIPTLR
jgi:hypothetical protein